MESLDNRKKTFIEYLTTLGGLLAIFLGFVVGATSFFLPYVIIFGLMFIVSALSSYTTLLFKDETKNRLIREYASFSYVALAISFGALVTTGVGQALSMIPGEYPTFLVYAGATLAISGSMVGTMILVTRVLGMGKARRELPFYAR
jgi:hypothetical protein